MFSNLVKFCMPRNYNRLNSYVAISLIFVLLCSSGDLSEGSHSSCATVSEDGLQHYFSWQHFELSMTLHLSIKKMCAVY